MNVNYNAAIEIFLFTIGLGFVGSLLLLGVVLWGRSRQAKALESAIIEIEGQTNG